jgi:3-oxoacyl-[acyl-carrier protein] reductase
VLVTGASRGIGEAITRLFVSEGAQVVALDVAEAAEGLSTMKAELGVEALALDITASDAAEVLLADALARGYDVVIHNAGITRDRTLARMEPREWDSVMAVNLSAPLAITRALVEGGGMRANGRIVAVSSLSGIAGNMGQSNYALSKAAWIGAVRRLAPQLAEQGITINAVAPGFIETQMTAAVPIAIREAGRRMNSMSQGGLPVDVAETHAWLAHPASGAVNGQVVRVCGQSLLGA